MRDLHEYFRWIERAYREGNPQALIEYPIARLLQNKKLDEETHGIISEALHDLSKECKSILEEWHSVGSEQKISHYTKFGALENILKGNDSNRMRQYNVAYFNDPLEGAVFPDALAPEMCKFIYGWEKEIPHEIEAGGKTFSVYVCAFTANEDRLDMWRAYGNNGDGYSITSTVPNYLRADKTASIMGDIHILPNKTNYSMDDIQRYTIGTTSIMEDIHTLTTEGGTSSKPSKSNKPDDKIRIYKVLYGEEKIKDTVGRLAPSLSALHSALQKTDNNEVYKTVKAVAEPILADLRYLYKDEAYELEEEYRIIRVVEFGSNLLHPDERTPPRLFIDTPPFLFLEKGCKIIIGPSCCGNGGGGDFH